MPPTTFAFLATENIGTIPQLLSTGHFQVHENVGDTLPPLTSTAYFVTTENVGATLTLAAAPATIDENIVIKPRYVGWGHPVD